MLKGQFENFKTCWDSILEGGESVAIGGFPQFPPFLLLVDFVPPFYLCNRDTDLCHNSNLYFNLYDYYFVISIMSHSLLFQSLLVTLCNS